MIFPNPTTGKAFISGKFTGRDYILKITNQLGLELANVKLEADIFPLEIGRLFKKGVYILSVVDNQGKTIEMKKMVIQ